MNNIKWKSSRFIIIPCSIQKKILSKLILTDKISIEREMRRLQGVSPIFKNHYFFTDLHSVIAAKFFVVFKNVKSVKFIKTCVFLPTDKTNVNNSFLKGGVVLKQKLGLQVITSSFRTNAPSLRENKEISRRFIFQK